MKRLIPIVALLFVALLSSAQTATYNTPVSRSSETKIIVTNFHVLRDCACATIDLEVQDSNGVVIRPQSVGIPDPNIPTASLVGLTAAMETVRATETGNAIRKMNFRILGYLSDQGYLSGVTVNP
jgi:hypothetical protein